MSVNPRRPRRTAVIATCLITALSVSGVGVAQADTPSTAGRQAVPGSVARAVVDSGKVVGSVPASRNMSVQFWLVANLAGATAYADDVSNPHSTDFRHYLSPADYTARFGPSAATVTAVSTWLAQQGFTGISVDSQRDYVRASAPAATVQSALQVQMKEFSVAGSAKPVISNDRDVTLPTSIAADVTGISGLDNLAPKTMLAVTKPAADPSDGCSVYFGQNVKTGLPPINGTTTLPTNVCGYTGTQLRAVYGMNDANTGKGVTVAYIEDGTPYKMFDTLGKWAQATGLPAPRSQNYSELSLGQGDACGNPFDIEEQLDIEAGYAMAPGQHQLLVGGDSCEQQDEGLQAVIDADLAVLDGNGQHPLASLTSNSWEIPGGEGGPHDQYDSILHSLLLRAAAEGVGMYYSSGDAPGVEYPSSDPYALAIGGTSLGIGADNKRLFETGWSNDVDLINSAGTGYTDVGILAGAGGGSSLLWNEPAYQKGVVPGSMAKPPVGDQPSARAVPDISALADLTTGIREATTEPGTDGGPDVYSTLLQGGTSLAAPLVTGMVAAAQQGQPAAFGFINPLLYSLAGTKAVQDVLPITASTPAQAGAVYCEAQDCGAASVWTLDAQAEGKTNQVTAAGYDTMTGVGTPNGQNFVKALRR
jgi:subtilase family serine protease